jgi:vitamin B12 transporter
MGPVIVLLILHSASLVFSQEQKDEEEVEEIVVTATRLETPSSHVGSSVTVITDEELVRTGKTFLHDALRAVPGLDVVRRGGEGQQTSLFIRGANSEHTLVLIDGVEANDPISPNRAFDFANLTIDNIERVEILRGPQSPLYGSDAIGGVISIITKKGKGKPSLTVSGEYGSFQTNREMASLSGGYSTADFSFSASRFDTDGISVASEEEGNSERDGYENTTLSGKLAVRPLEKVEVAFVGRYIDSDAEIDPFGGDDPNSVQETEQLFLRGQIKVGLFKEKWENIIGLELSKTDRKNRDEPDTVRPNDRSDGTFHGQIMRGNWQGNVFLSGGNVLVYGIDIQEEKGESEFFSESIFGPFTSSFDEQAARIEGYFFQGQASLLERLYAIAGFRIDHHSIFGSEITYRFVASYNLENTGTRLKGTFGTGFKAPSLFQLFDPASGNPDLEPEKSKGWDVGVEQVIANGRMKAGITYFKNEFKNLIDFTITNPNTFEGELRNIGNSESEGIELFSLFNVIDPVTLSAQYTYNDARDKDSDELLLKRARNRFNVSFDYRFSDRGAVHATVAYTGERRDLFTDPNTFITQNIVLGGYTLINISASYDVGRGITFFSRVDNLLDKKYEESRGFGTPGISGFFGMKAVM